MIDLGYNYRLCDLQCALGISQLRKLPGWVSRRQELARRYDRAFREMPEFMPLAQRPGVKHAYHLYVVRLDLKGLGMSREEAVRSLRAAGIGVNVHYVPVHLHPYYREGFGTVPGLCPVAEAAYEQILSLPIFPRMLDRDVDQVLATLRQPVTRRAHKV